ncbi:MAG: FtsW/RodA/SpoVE family cell cycle protein [Dehalococcoidia bacterium]
MVALTVAGLVAVYSASFVVGAALLRDPNYYIIRQVIWAVIGAGLAIVTVNLPTERLRKHAGLLMWLTLLALIAVATVGVTVNGAKRWIGVGPFTLQPAEYAKFTVVVFLAAWLASREIRVLRSWGGMVPFAAIMAAVCGLIMFQPSLGTTLVIATTAITMLWMRGMPFRHTLGICFTGALLALILVLVSGYRSDRLFSWIGTSDTTSDDTFQIDHAVTSMGNGGLTGLGIGTSRGKFFYIPESHTDGVYAIVGEEAGFIGAIAILGLFVILAIRGYQVALRASGHPFPHLIAVGISTWFIVQAILNIGGITGRFPLTGVPLPFMSYGGNALAAELMAVGALIRISRDFPPPRRVSDAPPIDHTRKRRRWR